jgi:branched-chain amino acid transport system substrate-binding protein
VTVTHDTVDGTTQCQEGTGSVTEYPAEASKIAAAKDPVVFYAGYYCGFADLTKALRSAGYKGHLVSDDGSEASTYVTDAGKADAAGAVASCACTDLLSSDGMATATFISQFKKLAHFGVDLQPYTGEAYDATNTIISVLKHLGTGATRSKVVSALHSVSYTGLTKTVKFLANGNVSGTAVYMYAVEKGNFVELGPISKLAG